jgi:hypothetical protein
MGSSAAESDDEKAHDLGELLEETRILLPGSEVLVAFLISLPFTGEFVALTNLQRGVFLATFFSALAALICFVMPAAYHRLARPIRNKAAFKVLANRLLIAGLIPLSLSLPLATYLVTSLAATNTIAMISSVFVLLLIGGLWWALPLIRAHDQFRPDEATEQQPPLSSRAKPSHS